MRPFAKNRPKKKKHVPHHSDTDTHRRTYTKHGLLACLLSFPPPLATYVRFLSTMSLDAARRALHTRYGTTKYVSWMKKAGPIVE